MSSKFKSGKSLYDECEVMSKQLICWLLEKPNASMSLPAVVYAAAMMMHQVGYSKERAMNTLKTAYLAVKDREERKRKESLNVN